MSLEEMVAEICLLQERVEELSAKVERLEQQLNYPRPHES